MAAVETRPETTDVRTWSVKPPAVNASVTPRYVKSLDSLFLFLGDPSRPSVGFVYSENLTALVDPETDEILGFEIDHFTSEAVSLYPELKPLMALPGMPAIPSLKAKRQGPDVMQRVQDVIATILDQLFGANGGTCGGHAALA